MAYLRSIMKYPVIENAWTFKNLENPTSPVRPCRRSALRCSCRSAAMHAHWSGVGIFKSDTFASMRPPARARPFWPFLSLCILRNYSRFKKCHLTWELVEEMIIIMMMTESEREGGERIQRGKDGVSSQLWIAHAPTQTEYTLAPKLRVVTGNWISRHKDRGARRTGVASVSVEARVRALAPARACV